MCKWIYFTLIVVAVSLLKVKVAYRTQCNGFDLDASKRIIKLDLFESDGRCFNCSCIITATHNYTTIRLTFSLFQLYDFSWRSVFGDTEINDWLRVYDGETTLNTSLGNFTGTKLPFTVQSSSRSMRIQFEVGDIDMLRLLIKASYYYTKAKDKPKIVVPSPVVRTVPDHLLWCSAEGTPPIKISLLVNSTSLSSGIGMVMTRAEKEGIYTCRATNEVGSDLKKIPVTFVGCESFCSGNGRIDENGQVENEYSCRNISSKIAIFKCLPTTATKLFLQKNKITNLPTRAFRHMASLKVLDLQLNEISNISSGAFDDVKGLSELNLKGNRIKNLTANVFSSLVALQVLDLSSNNIRLLPTGIFTKQTSLIILNLDSNGIQRVPPEIFSKLPRLMSLELAWNDIQTLPESISKHSGLVVLDLSHNKIEGLPEWIFQNISFLQYLYVNHNLIKVLPEGIIQNSSELLFLNMANNKIKSIRAEHFPYKGKLRFLFLQNNCISQIPSGAFSNLRLLIYLMLSDNLITSISSSAFTISEGRMLSVFVIRNKLETVSLLSFTEEFPYFITNISMEDGQIGTLEFVDLNANWKGHRLILHLGLGDSKYIDILKCIKILDSDKVLQNFRDKLLQAFHKAGFAKRGSAECEVGPCPTGTYLDASVRDPSKLQCMECPAGGFYSDTKAYVGDSCLKCPKGTFVPYSKAPGKRASDCIACPQGTNTSMLAGFRACKCLNGFYRLHLFEGCKQCDQAGLKCVNDFATIEPGYWWNWTNQTHQLLYKNYTRNLCNITPVLGMNSSRSDVIIEYPHILPMPHKCPRNESCKGGQDSKCDTGYAGPLCAVCSSGYYKQFQTCKNCPTKKLMVVQLSIAAAVIAIIIALVVWTSKKKIKDRSGRSWVDIILARLKILIGFYQVTFGVLEAFAYIKWPESLALIGKYSEMLQMNVIQIAPILCLWPRLELDAFGSLFAILGINAAVILMSLIIYGLRKLFLMRSMLDERDIAAKSSQAKELIYRNLFFVLYVTYLSTCSKTAHVLPLACRELCGDENVKDCPKFLKVDYNIQCQGPKYNRMVIVAYCAVIYVILLPTASMIVLWKQRKVLGINEAEDETSDAQEQRKELISGLRFLFENYNSQSWYWEFVETVRKLVLTSGLILVGGESRAYIGLACVMSGLYGMFFAYVGPIKDKFENRLMLISLAVTFVNLGIGAVSKIPKENIPASIDPYVDSIVFQVLVIGANSLVVGLLVVQYLLFIYRYIKTWRKNPQWSFSCCLAMLLPLNELQGELRGLTGRNILRQQLRSEKMNMPSISSTFKEGAIEFSLEENDEAEGVEAKNCDKEYGASSEVTKRSKVGDNTDNPANDVTIANIHEPPCKIYETSL